MQKINAKPEPTSSSYTGTQIVPSLPGNKSFLVWLTHDVDRIRKTFFHSIYYAVKKRRLSHLSPIITKQNPYWNFERIMELEGKYGVRSTFFFLNESMTATIRRPYSFVLAKGRYRFSEPPVRAIIQKIDRAGWEVGLHGSYNSFHDRALLQGEKELLEKIINHPVPGIRQHYLNLEIPRTWEIQRSLGLEYDASFGLTRDVGFRDDVYYPFRPFKDKFIVFPLAIMDSALFSKYPDIESAWEKCLRIINIAQEKKGLLTLLWHQRVFNTHDFPGYLEVYERLIKECLNRNAQFCTGKDIHRYL